MITVMVIETHYSNNMSELNRRNIDLAYIYLLNDTPYKYKLEDRSLSAYNSSRTLYLMIEDETYIENGEKIDGKAKEIIDRLLATGWKEIQA